ncbi:hypothetical protein ACFQ0G_32870 [Streptomyces chiangmaiensis]
MPLIEQLDHCLTDPGRGVDVYLAIDLENGPAVHHVEADDHALAADDVRSHCHPSSRLADGTKSPFADWRAHAHAV